MSDHGQAFPRKPSEEVPVRTILATIGLVIATYLAWLLVQRLSHILELIVIAIFFALVLNPAVDFLEKRLHVRRAIAATFVFLTGLIAFTFLVYVFIEPLVNQTSQLIDKLPQSVQDARNGKGSVGHIVQKYNLDKYVQDNQEKLRDAVTSSTGSIVAIFSAVGRTIATLLTVLVLAFLMLLYGRDFVKVPLIFIDPSNQERVRRVANDAAKAVTGYTLGNLLISLIAGVVTLVTLELLGVPFSIVLAVWVAFADLIPLIGATLGAIPTVMVAAIHSPTAGIVTLIVFIVYQQIENHLIQTAIMSKTVKLNPLIVLVSALIGVELAGLLGALLAIPVAGVIQVVGRDLYDHRHHRFRGEPTVGVDQVPISDLPDD